MTSVSEKREFLLGRLLTTSLFAVLTSSLVFSTPAQARFPSDMPFGDRLTDGAPLSLYGQKKIVLTFDDGPSEFTPALLDLLKKRNVKATFFIIGDKVDSQSLPILKRIIDEGHILGSHSWTHFNAEYMDSTTFGLMYENSILQLHRILTYFGGNPNQLYFRLPYGGHNASTGKTMLRISRKLFGGNCVDNVFWNITAYDWVKSMTAQSIYQVVLHQIVGTPLPVGWAPAADTPVPNNGGGVILFHDGISLEELNENLPDLRKISQIQNTLDAVTLLLDNADKYGIQVVPLNEVKEYSTAGKACNLQH